MRLFFALLCLLFLLSSSQAQYGYMGGIGAGDTAGGIGGGVGFGIIAGTVGSAPAPPSCTTANGTLDFSNVCDSIFYTVGLP